MIGTLPACACEIASRVCGITPSSAATTRMTMPVSDAPRALNAVIPGNAELTIELSILNAAGNGIDHNIDFTRVELAFRFKW